MSKSIVATFMEVPPWTTTKLIACRKDWDGSIPLGHTPAPSSALNLGHPPQDCFPFAYADVSGVRPYRRFLSLSISSNNRGMSCLALAIKSWSAVVAPLNSISVLRPSPIPVLIKLDPLVWSRPSTNDCHGPGVALSQRRRISSNSMSFSGFSCPLIFESHRLGFGTVGVNKSSA